MPNVAYLANTLALVVAVSAAVWFIRYRRRRAATPPKAYAYPLAPRSVNVARALDEANRALSAILFEPELQMRLGMTSAEAKDLAFARDLVVALRARA